MKRLLRILAAFTHDVVMAALAFLFALYLRLGSALWLEQPLPWVMAMLLFTTTAACVFWASGLYRAVWRYISIRELSVLLRAATITVVLFIVFSFLTSRLESIPRSVPIIAWFVLAAFTGGPRLAFRLLREGRLLDILRSKTDKRIPVLLLGAGDEAELFIRRMAKDPEAAYQIIGVLDPKGTRVGRSIHGVSVMGTLGDLPKVMSGLRRTGKAPAKLILTRALDATDTVKGPELLDQCAMLGLTLGRLPPANQLQDRNGSNNQANPIALEDLLGRPETILNRGEIRNLIHGQRVLVTGAGGSIGSELVRQIAQLGPAHITLIEISEYNLYKIQTELADNFPALSCHAILADIREHDRLVSLTKTERPDLIFHAAAIKHVPLAEDNVRETIYTNIIGTQNVADAAAAAGAAAMVMISSDKAVNPTNIMGATKRVAEACCQVRDLKSVPGGTRYMTVRFGNVLGSNGSVAPRFEAQIRKGGPVTVTHPDITRYFMTLREAVELVLQASAYGVNRPNDRGRIFVLDMGTPVKLVDLARQMIRLAGHTPDEDIKITYTGLRPGEKLYEELFTEGEAIVPSDADGVRLATPRPVDAAQLANSLTQLADELHDRANPDRLKQLVTEIVPEYKVAGTP
jgi:FlaA1/EpsC-like NDP-sugar epimerase